MDDVLKAELGKKLVGRLASGAAVIASICDMVEFEKSSLDAAFYEYDYGKAIGHTVQTLGASCAVYSASVILAWSLGASITSCGTSLIIGVIGSGLILGGSLLAAWLTKNPNENFARFSFLRKRKNSLSLYETPWHKSKMPTKSKKMEAKILIALLSQFNLRSVTAKSNDYFLKITPGYLEPDSVFEIDVLERSRKYPSLKYTITVFMNEDEIAVDKGDVELPQSSFIKRNVDGIVDSIYVNLREANPQAFKRYVEIKAKVKLILNNDTIIPINNNWPCVEIVNERHEISSLDQSHWEKSTNEFRSHFWS